MLSDFRTASVTRESDLSRLPTFFALFCEHYRKDAALIIATKHDRQIVQLKQVFIAVILSLYCPGALEEPALIQQSQIGLTCGLGEVLGLNHGNVSKMIQCVISYMKVYDSFRQEVVDVAEKIYSHGKSVEQKNN